jgi:hypothetical protein
MIPSPARWYTPIQKILSCSRWYTHPPDDSLLLQIIPSLARSYVPL